MTSAPSPGWVANQRAAAARRRERCAKCGVRGNKTKLIETEAGLYCRPHEAQLSPLIARYDEDQDHDVRPT